MNIMMKIFIVLFLFYLTKTRCSQVSYSQLSYNLKFENHLKRFPWMALITNNKLMYYGTIIHERAVLTLPIFPVGKLYSDFTVKYDIYYRGNYLQLETLPYREIQEYNIIESNENSYHKDLAILIVDKPFPPVSTYYPYSRLILLVKNQNDVDDEDCITLSLRTFDANSDYVTIMYAMKIKLENGEFYIDVDEENEVSDDQGQIEHLNTYENFDKIMNIVGGPVVCRSKKSNRHWIQHSVLQLEISTKDSFPIQISAHRPLINIPIEGIVERILYRARII